MNDLLVAIDGSKYSERIVESSCDFAKRLSDGIILLYVSKYPDLIEEYIEYGGREPVPNAERYTKIAEAVTLKYGERVKNKGIRCEIVLETGNPAEKIIQIANEKNVDMIIVGLKGLHGLDRIRSLGSISRRVIENSLCPVLVVTGKED